MSKNGNEIFLLICCIRKHFGLSATIYIARMFKLLKSHRSGIVIFEIAPKHTFSESLADYDGYSISSKGFLPTVVEVMII